jgi:diguanylate cyclase (GGDEF)-like protein
VKIRGIFHPASRAKILANASGGINRCLPKSELALRTIYFYSAGNRGLRVMSDSYRETAQAGHLKILQLSTEHNVKSISYVSYGFIAFQLFYLFNSRPIENGYFLASAIAAAVICMGYTVFTLSRYRQLVSNPIKARAVYMSFWLLMIVFGVTPFLISGISSGLPTAATLFLVAMLVFPMFFKRDIFIIFPIYGIYSLAVSAVFGAKLVYLIFIALISVAGMLMAILMQRRYFDLIVKFSSENRVDALTGMMNRRSGFDKMHAVIELCKRHCMNVVVYMMDLDHFRDFNDAYGRVRGDSVMVEISREVRRVFSRNSDVVFRMEGDEFAICTSVPKLRDAHDMARLLCASIEGLEIPVSRKDVSSYLTASVGYTIYKPQLCDTGLEADMDALSLLEEANSALYAAKNSGRNTVYSFVSAAQESEDDGEENGVNAG